MARGRGGRTFSFGCMVLFRSKANGTAWSRIGVMYVYIFLKSVLYSILNGIWFALFSVFTFCTMFLKSFASIFFLVCFGLFCSFYSCDIITISCV